MRPHLARRAFLVSLVLGVLVPSNAGAVDYPSGECPDSGELMVHCLAGQFADWDVRTATRIAWCESRWNPAAKNRRSSATGLYQILRMHDPLFRRHGWSHASHARSAWASTVVAHDLWLHRGSFADWNASRRCWT